MLILLSTALAGTKTLTVGDAEITLSRDLLTVSEGDLSLEMSSDGEVVGFYEKGNKAAGWTVERDGGEVIYSLEDDDDYVALIWDVSCSMKVETGLIAPVAINKGVWLAVSTTVPYWGGAYPEE